jgi:hypothetical protein
MTKWDFKKIYLKSYAKRRHSIRFSRRKNQFKTDQRRKWEGSVKQSVHSLGTFITATKEERFVHPWARTSWFHGFRHCGDSFLSFPSQPAALIRGKRSPRERPAFTGRRYNSSPDGWCQVGGDAGSAVRVREEWSPGNTCFSAIYRSIVTFSSPVFGINLISSRVTWVRFA